MSQIILKAPCHLVHPCPLGLCHLVPLSPGGPCHLVPLSPGPMSLCVPTFIAPDTDLLVGSPLYAPVAPPLGLGTGGWPPAPCEGRRGSPSRESTRVPHLVTPASRLGFSGAGGKGALAWGLSPGWTQASPGHVAGHAVSRKPPCWATLDPSPASCRGTWPRAGSSRTLALCTPASDVLSRTEWVFYNHLFSRCLTSFLHGLWRTTLTWALSAPRGGLCGSARLASLHHGLGPQMGPRGPSAHS